MPSGMIDQGCQAVAAGLGDLTARCIATILSMTTPRDVARLACVSKLFRAASYLDLLWEAWLPPSYADILAHDPVLAPSSTCTKKEVYDYFCHRVLRKGARDIWLDKATGGICHSIGARGLEITEGNDTRIWDWGRRRKGSRFCEVAYLKQVSSSLEARSEPGLEAKGRLECSFSPGTYTVSWRLFYRSEDIDRIKFALEVTGNEPVNRQCCLTARGARISMGQSDEHQDGEQQLLACRWDRFGWIEVDVGDFSVARKDSPIEVNFSMTQTENEDWKPGLYLDGVVIRPSFLIPSVPSNRIFLEDGTRHVWQDQATGGVCLSIGARGLRIARSYDERCWSWVRTQPGSMFMEVAHLVDVLYLSIEGGLLCYLPRGMYTLCWRLHCGKCEINSVQFTVRINGKRLENTQLVLAESGFRWVEHDVAEFWVESTSSPVEITFSLRSLEKSLNSDLYLDGVVIRPSHLIQYCESPG